MKKLLILLIILSFTTILAGCFGLESKLGIINGTATLDNKASSGIKVTIFGTQISTTTDLLGRYSFSGLIGGQYLLLLQKDGYTDVYISVNHNSGMNTTVDTVNLSSVLGGVYGYVRLDGQTNYSGITVSIYGTNTSTTSDYVGRYYFSELSSGNITLVFSKSGYNTASINVQITPGDTTYANPPVVLSISSSTTTTTTQGSSDTTTTTLSPNKGALNGYAYLNYIPSSGIRVACEGSGVSYSGYVLTDSNGYYSFTNLDPGFYNLIFSKVGFDIYNSGDFVYGGRITSADPANLTLTSGSGSSSGATIEGYVYLQSGSGTVPAIEALVGFSEVYYTNTNSEGYYSFSGISVGDYTLYYFYSGGGYGSGVLEFSINESQMGENVTLSGVILYPSSGSGSDVSLTSYDVSDLISDGTVSDMEFYNDRLYISTFTNKLYILNIGESGFSLYSEVFITQIYNSLFWHSDPSGTRELLCTYNHPSGMAYDRYLPGSGFMGSGVFLGVVPYGDISAVSVYSLSPTPYLVLYNSLTNKIGKYDIDDKILTYPSGWYTPGGDITSLKHNTDYSMFYACHSHYIYKFGSDFNLLESYNTFPSGTNLAGIAYEYEYEERIEHIWAISNNGAQKIIYDITNF